VAFYFECYLETKKRWKEREKALHWFDFGCVTALMQQRLSAQEMTVGSDL